MPNRSIFLVGMMGAGKSTVGRALAKRLAWVFIDTDHEIELSTGVRIPLIFDIEGEPGFRRRESQVLHDVVSKPRIVLATGGGIVLNPDNREILHDHGVVVYLRATPDDLFFRMRHDKNRPLLQTPDPEARIAALVAERDPLYMELADTVVDTGRQPIFNVVSQVLRQLRDVERIPPSPLVRK